MELADVAEAERCLARNRELVADLGQPGLAWTVMHHHATLCVLHADAAAEAAVVAACEFGKNIGQQQIFSIAHRFGLCVEQGRAGELAEWVGQAAERTQSPMMKALHAHILAETDQLDAAASVFDDLTATGFAHPTNNVAWLVFGAESAWLCARLGREDCVPRLRSMLEPYAEQLVVAAFAGWIAGSVAFYLGLLSTTVGDWSDAEARFAAAAATHERIRAPAWLARTHLEWARMLLTRADPGDGERAHDLLRQALVTARELGLGNVERQAASLLSQSA
jgi:hypothetical protein